MSLAISLIFSRRRWTMPLEPGMPAGLWVAGNRDEGDASGGDLTFQHIFQNVSNDLGDSNYYNIEQIMVSDMIQTETGARLSVTGMDPGTERNINLQPVQQDWTIQMLSDGTNVDTFSNIDIKKQVPIWIGTFKGFDTEFGDVLVRIQNPGASQQVGVKLQGYWWTPDAINAPGGMRRPPGSIYG